MADRYADRYQGDQYGRERGSGREDRGFADRARDEVRSWFGDEEAERRRRMDERARNRDWDYGPAYKQRWGDDPYRGEEWRGSYTGGGWRPEVGWRGGAGAGRSYGGADYGRLDYDRAYAGSYPSEPYYRPYGGEYGFGWEPGRRRDFAGRGPKGYQRSDARIYEDVCDRLADAPDIDASDIEVKTNNGEVTLSGTVRERGEKRRVEDLVESISGVREVHNNLRVKGWREGTTGTAASAGATAAPTATAGTPARQRR